MSGPERTQIQHKYLALVVDRDNNPMSHKRHMWLYIHRMIFGPNRGVMTVKFPTRV